ncbi:hypothetical protein JG687_00009643 [Phytophthora cactorum]|uniref:BZIP domain-containing protein n=1 Tax=Phytophthora cactorum TaxID=29920 RepID=A0A8T1UEI5_9STRA|nr:hypothetical protein JG687_00009643 [Phytophthora cactorum]
MLSTEELKRQASLDKRRRRNREAMQRARQRDKDHMESLRLEAQHLEDTHQMLLRQVDQSLSQISVSGSQNDRIADLQQRLEDTREQANKLMRQNRVFQEQLGERVKGEDRMEGLLKEMARDQQIQERVYRQLCRNWENEIKFVTYRSASEAATQQFHVVQKVNDDTYLIAREKQDPDNEGKVVRLLYLRFRLLEANGSYAVLEDGMDTALASPNLEVMANYVKELSTKNRNSKVSLIGIFTTHYGDDAVAKALVTAQKKAKTADMENTIRQLRNNQLSAWLNSEKSVDDVFNLLKLRKDSYAALASGKLEVLDDYMKLFNRAKSGQETLLGVLTKGFGGEQILAKLLVVAKEKPLTKALVSASRDVNTKAVAKQLRSEQLDDWLNNQKTVDDVFKLLKLRDDGYFALTSRKLVVLKAYIKVINREKSGHETLLKTLTTGFGGESELAKILLTAKADPLTSKLATSLQTELLDRWLTYKLLPESVLRKLTLDRSMANVLSDQNLHTLTAYISMYNAKNPSSKTSLIETLSTHYGDDVVAKALVIAKYDDATKALATFLQKQQLQTWLKTEKSADGVFKLLKIKHDDFLPMKSQKLQTLNNYVSLFNGKNPQDKTNMFTVVRNGFGGDGGLARMVARVLVHSQHKPETALKYQKELFNQWFNRNVEPKNIYSMFLNVNKTSADMTEKTIVARYARYYKKRVAQVKTFNNPRRT